MMDAKYKSLNGENVIVVGTGGIGGAIVKDFLEQGSTVYALDKSKKVLKGLCEDKKEIHKHKIDVTAHEEYRNLIRNIGEQCKPEWISLLEDKPKPIRSFVYTPGLGVSTSIGETSHQTYEDLFKLNVLGFMDGVEAVVPYMKKGSSITVISSLNAYRSEHGMAGYDSTKAALKQFAQTAAADLGSKGIRVNSVAPGYIRTPQTVEELNNPVSKKRIEDATVLGRIGEPRDVSSVVVWLASEDAKFVTGECIEISGGLALAQYPPIEKQITKF